MAGYRVPLKEKDSADWTGRYGFDAWFERTTTRSYVLGLDLGQAADPSALAVIEVLRQPDAKPGQRLHAIEDLKFITRFAVRHLERLPLRTTYPWQVDQVERLMFTAPLSGNAKLVIDHTGVGRPVFDLFRTKAMHPVGITITSSADWSRDGLNFHVGKGMLVSQLVRSFQNGDLKLAAGLPELAALVNELKNFQVSYSEGGRASFGARVGRHDDLVLAVAIACWYAHHRNQNRVTVSRLQGLTH